MHSARRLLFVTRINCLKSLDEIASSVSAVRHRPSGGQRAKDRKHRIEMRKPRAESIDEIT